LNLTTNKLNGTATSSSKGMLKGSANLAKIDITTSSEITAKDFVVAVLDCSAAASSIASFDVTESLKGKVTTLSKVYYKKKPSLIEVNKTSSSFVGKI